MKTIRSCSFYIISVLFLILFSCEKDKVENEGKQDCFNKQLYEQHKNDFCPANCTGVTGCDGKIYCNACEASRQGITVKP